MVRTTDLVQELHKRSTQTSANSPPLTPELKDEQLKKFERKDNNSNNSGNKSRAATVRRKIFSRLPSDYTSNHKYYISSYITALCYFTFLFVVWEYQYRFGVYAANIDYYDSSNGNINLHLLLNYLYYKTFEFLLCIPFGWCITAMVGAGHDAIHECFAPRRTKIGKFLNWFITRITWDIWMSYTANEDHFFHHKYTNTKEDESMIVVDMRSGLMGELWHNLRFGLLEWMLGDLRLVFNITDNNSQIDKTKRNSNKVGIWVKLYMILLMINRFLLMVGVYYNIGFSWTNGVTVGLKIRPLVGFINWCFGGYFINLIIFGSHVSPVDSIVSETDGKKEINDMYLYHLNNGWEFFPTNDFYGKFQQFIHCGATFHASHHCFTFIPKSLLYIVAEELKEMYPDAYRGVYSMKEEMRVWRSRKVPGIDVDFVYSKDDIDNSIHS